MKKESKKLIGLFARYIFILILGLGNLFLIYKIVTPGTIFIVKNIIILFENTVVSGNLFYFKKFTVELIPACVAGSAFFLMILLVFSTPDIAPKKRFFALATAVILLLLLNCFRIIFLILMAQNSYYEIIHWIFWNLISVFFVVVIWLLTIKIYKIEKIPVYDDIRFLLRLRKRK